MTQPSENKPTHPPPPAQRTTPASAASSSPPSSSSRRPPAAVPPPPTSVLAGSKRPSLARARPTPPTKPEPRRPHYHPDAKLSMLALLGVVWASLFFIMLILTAVRGNTLLLPEIRPPLWHMLLDYVIQPLGWSAPIAATVLGLLAIGRIQKSDGTQYGLSLGLFDALLFPLLVLDLAIVWLGREGASALIQQDVMSPAVAGAILGQAVPIIAIILGDYYLATRAWGAIQPDEPE